MKKIYFETNEPLFSFTDTANLMSVTASIIVEASKKRFTSFKAWADFIDRWCETNGMPEEIRSHMYEVVIPALNALKRHE